MIPHTTVTDIKEDSIQQNPKRRSVKFSLPISTTLIVPRAPTPAPLPPSPLKKSRESKKGGVKGIVDWICIRDPSTTAFKQYKNQTFKALKLKPCDPKEKIAKALNVNPTQLPPNLRSGQVKKPKSGLSKVVWDAKKGVGRVFKEAVTNAQNLVHGRVKTTYEAIPTGSEESSELSSAAGSSMREGSVGRVNVQGAGSGSRNEPAEDSVENGPGEGVKTRIASWRSSVEAGAAPEVEPARSQRYSLRAVRNGRVAASVLSQPRSVAVAHDGETAVSEWVAPSDW